MIDGMPTQSRLTTADLDASRRLRRLWEQRKAEREEKGDRLTQADAAEALSMSPGAVSQYLNGHLAIGYVATFRWARFLEVAPEEIRPDIQELTGAMHSGDINDELLGELIEQVDTVALELRQPMSSQQKAKLIKSYYKECVESGSRPSPEIVRMIMRVNR